MLPSTEAGKGFSRCNEHKKANMFLFFNSTLLCSLTNMVLILLRRSGCIFVCPFLRLAQIQGWYSVRLMCKTCTECGAVNLHGVWTKGVVAVYLACVTADGV